MSTTNNPAGMGYIGGVNLFGTVLRVTSCGLTPKQKIDLPPVIDGTVDNTMYQLGGFEIGGEVKFPVMSGSGFEGTIWGMATARDSGTGELTQTGIVVVKYYQGIGRTFDGARINTMEFRASAGDKVEASADIWAVSFEDGGDVAAVSGPATRILQWSDVSVGGSDIETCLVKEITVQVNNNLSRNYTFCPDSGLFPNNISTGKRMLNGSLTFQGFAPTDGQAEANKNKTSPDASLSLKFGDLVISFPQVIWELQNIEAQPGLITSSANYYPLADGGGSALG
jgi:hypothetical protein